MLSTALLAKATKCGLYGNFQPQRIPATHSLSQLPTLVSHSKLKLPCMNGWITQTYRYCCACGRTSILAMVQVVCLPNAWLRTVLKISSVLEDKGSKRNNPNVKEFREVLRAAMVDVILPQSDSSNCAEDADRFLLTHSLQQVYHYQYCCGIISCARACRDTIQVADCKSMPTKCGLISCVMWGVCPFLCGRLLCPKGLCKCLWCMSGSPHRFLVRVHIYMSSSWIRKYSELKGQGLIVLSEELFTVIKHLEESYQKRTEMYLHLEMYELTFYKEWRITWGKVSAVLSLCWALGGLSAVAVFGLGVVCQCPFSFHTKREFKPLLCSISKVQSQNAQTHLWVRV